MKHIPMKPIPKMSQRTFRKEFMSFGFADRNEANYCVNFIKSRKGTVSRRLFIEVAWHYMQDLSLYMICNDFDWLSNNIEDLLYWDK